MTGIPTIRVNTVRVHVILMRLTKNEEMVLAAIVTLGKGDPATPVIISAIHHAFADMDVSALVVHLGTLLDYGLIRNARDTSERLGNSYVITPDGIGYYNRNIRTDP